MALAVILALFFPWLGLSGFSVKLMKWHLIKASHSIFRHSRAGCWEAAIYVPKCDLHLLPQAEAPEEEPEEEDLRNEVSHIGYRGGRSRVVGWDWCCSVALFLSTNTGDHQHTNWMSLAWQGSPAWEGSLPHPHVMFQVLQFNTNCPECNTPAQTNMKLVRIFCQAVGLLLTWLRCEDYPRAGEHYSLPGKHRFSKW